MQAAIGVGFVLMVGALSAAFLMIALQRRRRVIVSYFEWAQNRAALAWTLDEVRERLRHQMTKAVDSVWECARADGISPRLAANAIAVERVAEATRLRGQYP
jgi:glutamate dehydrogenase (NAD(P)+)